MVHTQLYTTFPIGFMSMMCCEATYFLSISILLSEGITGRVTFDGNGDRVPLFIVDNVQNSKFIAMQYLEPDANSTFISNGKFLFPGGTTVPPRDIPVCGFSGELCPKGSVCILSLNKYAPANVLLHS